MTAIAIATKCRRALRNGTGATFSSNQIRELVEFGALELITKIEVEELCREKAPPISSVIIGSTNVGMADLRRSGKLPTPTNDQLFIAALTANA